VSPDTTITTSDLFTLAAQGSRPWDKEATLVTAVVLRVDEEVLEDGD